MADILYINKKTKKDFVSWGFCGFCAAVVLSVILCAVYFGNVYGSNAENYVAENAFGAE